MATISQVRQWNPTALESAAATISTNNRTFRQSLESMNTDVDNTLQHWEGDGAAAASARALADCLTGNHIFTAVFAESDALAEAAAALGAARSTVLGIVDDALARGMRVSDSGHVTAPTFGSGEALADLFFQAQMNDQAKQIEARLIPALNTADEVDRSAATALNKAATDLGDLNQSPSGTRLDDSVTAILDGHAFVPEDPRAFNDFWESLSPTDKDALAAYDPSIGNRDGMPAVDKDNLNRAYLDALGARAAADVVALHDAHPDWADGRNIPPDSGVVSDHDQQARKDYDQWVSDRTDAQRTADGYRTLTEHVNADGTPRYLLGVDEQGRAAVALENPDTATHVATFVPGTGSHLGTIGGDLDRSQWMLDAATHELDDAGLPGSVSVVAWYGYDAPQTIPDAGLDKFAEAGTAQLDRFQDGLRAAHDGAPSHNTIIGHSYGSTVIGNAASDAHSLAADDLFFVGSPGVDVNHVSGLHLDGIGTAEMGGHVYATAAAFDPVPMIGDVAGVHGPNPAREILGYAPFGATVVESAPGTYYDVPGFGPMPNPAAHSEYWNSGNSALTGMARVIAGLGAP
ncbi:alpha/beta hydrolase [Rhodococcus sp. NPDC056743]|uniref:alpha/beta hydrolase n=1 Tax=Rhodococcus sp. NPDC056743 TaxID=3345934 RepID=UPI003671077C